MLDASIVAVSALDDERPELAIRAMDEVAAGEAIVPDLMWHEVRSLLANDERRGRLAPRQAMEVVQSVRRLPLERDSAAHDRSVLALARRHHLTSYDAAYLKLAMRVGGRLATLDRALARAARAEGVELVG